MTWSDTLNGVACEVCHNAYLLPADTPTQICPNCYRDELDTAPEAPLSESELYAPPERVIPFIITPDAAVGAITSFAEGIPFPPEGLQPAEITKRLRRVYLPVWLVDGDVTAKWRADLGTHYKVVSHKEEMHGGQWQTREVEKTRTRWEPHLGNLHRSYDNIPAPAVEGYGTITQRVGKWEIAQSQPFDEAAIADSFIQLPSRPQSDAWREAQAEFLRYAEREVQKAAQSDEIRDFEWQPEFDTTHWTQMLVPLYTTYYTDDNDQKRVIFVHGQTGGVYGALQASLKSATGRIAAFAGAAVVIFILSVIAGLAGLFFPPLLILTALGIIAAGGLGIAAIGPVIQVNQYNAKHDDRQPWLKARTN